MKKRPATILLAALVIAASLLDGCTAGNSSDEGRRAGKSTVFIEKVVDGDSVEAVIQGSREHIRLIGIDAPELAQRPWGKRAKKRLEQMVAASGWEVRIEYDVERRDMHQRILAYLWGRDGKMINEEMVRNGYAVVFTFPPNVKYVERFKAAQVIARENKLGIWGKAGLRQLPSDYRREHPRL